MTTSSKSIRDESIEALKTVEQMALTDIPPDRMTAALLGIIAGATCERTALAADAHVSLRDQFAMAAMQGDWASQSNKRGFFTERSPDKTLVDAAIIYYRMADAMMKARDAKA